MNKSLVDSISNRSDLKLLNDIPNLMKEEEKKDPELEEKFVVSEALSEVSANDYGYFTLKIQDDREEIKRLEQKKGFLGVINDAIKKSYEISLKKNNYINLLNKDTTDISGKKYKLIKSDFELIMYLGRDENEFKNFKLINPNEEIYKKLVNNR
jgi:hypothetical protein